MIKNIIREVSPENMDTSFYFDGDTFTDRAGDYNYNLFIITDFRFGKYSGFNMDAYKEIIDKAEEIIDGFSCVENDCVDYDGKGYTYKEIIEDAGYKYNPSFCHKLKEWYKGNTNTDRPETIANFLTIVTGQEWKTKSVCGYCQGDYAEIIYCTKYYKKPEIEGEIYIGCCKEFSVSWLDDEGKEEETVCGFFVADCQIKTEADYKTIICEWEGLNPEETQLEMIEKTYTVTHYDYKVI